MNDSDCPEVPGYVLRRLALTDADDWARFALLPESQRYTSTQDDSVADLLPVIQRSLSADVNAPRLFAVREAASGLMVATVGFHTVSALNGTAEVTYGVAPTHAGRGLATALCDAAVRWAFTQCGWVRVQATTLEPHVASQRVLLKCGFTFEGRLRNFRRVRGEPRDYLLFARVPGPSP